MGGSYDVYLNSYAWEQRRRRYWSEHPRYCSGCGSWEAVLLHHLSYDQLGDEPDEDLIPLCLGCHNDVHSFVNDHRISLREGSLLWLGQHQGPAWPRRSLPPFVPRQLRGYKDPPWKYDRSVLAESNRRKV